MVGFRIIFKFVKFVTFVTGLSSTPNSPAHSNTHTHVTALKAWHHYTRKPQHYNCFHDCHYRAGACPSHPLGCGLNGFCCRKEYDMTGDCAEIHMRACEGYRCCIYKGHYTLHTFASLNCICKLI